MKNNIEVGNIVKGKVTGIKPFGAFVALDESTQGLVHISEIAHGFVKDINDYLSVGDEVDVKVISVDEKSEKISLSIRETLEKPKKKFNKKPNIKAKVTNDSEGFNLLEDELKKWMKNNK